jgi:hypothetical protein
MSSSSFPFPSAAAVPSVTPSCGTCRRLQNDTYQTSTPTNLVGPWTDQMRQMVLNMLSPSTQSMTLDAGEEPNLHWILKTCQDASYAITGYNANTKTFSLQYHPIVPNSHSK